MKQCPKCNTLHDKPGTYCSRSCANSKVWSAETQAKRSASIRRYNDSRSSVDRQAHIDATQSTRIRVMLAKPFDDMPYPSKRKRVILEQDGKCFCCNLSEWMGQSLRLELDHINGDHADNRRENLQAICPNCHSQTPNWRGKTTELKWKEIERLLVYKRLLDS